jgi:hypothetical protein
MVTRARTSRLLPLCLALLAGACATPMESNFDFDPGASFSGYRSWYWLTDDRSITPPGREPGVSPLTLGRIADAIERELVARGFDKAPSRDKADFVVDFTVGSRERITVESYPWYYRGPWHWRPYYWEPQYVTRTYRVGTLAIDVFDQHSRAPAWHGWASKRITARDIEAPEQPIAEAVAAILANFPPPAPTPHAGGP